MKGIYKFYWDWGRHGYLSGVFVATKEAINNLIGQEVYFGEVLGKHSEVYATIESKDIKLVTEDANFIELFEKFGLSTGYNPLNYLREE